MCVCVCVCVCVKILFSDIWKLKFNLDKFKVLHIGLKNIQMEYKIKQLGNKECKLDILSGGLTLMINLKQTIIFCLLYRGQM